MKIRALSDEEASALANGLALAAKLVDGTVPLSTDQVQELYDALREVDLEFAEGRIALGLAFGETIVAKAGYEWVRVSDQFGEETSLSPHGIQLACHPITMLQKRLDRGEVVDIAELRDETIKTIETGLASGDYDKR